MADVTADRADLARGTRALNVLVGAIIVDAHAELGTLVLDVSHIGCDDDACQLRVPLAGIRFEREQEA